MPGKFIATWLEAETPDGSPANVTVLRERPAKRVAVKKALRKTVLEHLVGADIIQSMGGFKKAAVVIRNALPATKISRSADLGEILATEFVDQTSDYTVPIRRLRFKDDRAVAMRGDDVLGFDFSKDPIGILKGEAKSRAKLTTAVVTSACDAVCRNHGRPNPSTLGFISRRLREAGKHDLAEEVEKLQESSIPLRSIGHLIFTLSGNDPAALLSKSAKSPIKGIKRQLAGCQIKDHSKFISDLFDELAAEDES
jgi:hypothetical protein